MFLQTAGWFKREIVCAERWESELCYMLQRGQRRKQDTAAVRIKREKWAVYRIGGKKRQQNHKKPSE